MRQVQDETKELSDNKANLTLNALLKVDNDNKKSRAFMLGLVV
ncbi:MULTISPECIES: hypothetical protein [Vibrio]|jgi:hypothetical protein|nr:MULTISPECIES: hypothetical protein [Vibrio]